MSVRFRAVALTTLATIAVFVPLAARAHRGPDRTPRAVRSVLMISLPATSWIDIRDNRVPNLTRIFRQATLANLATRSVRSRTEPGAGYLVMGTGTRSVAGEQDAAPNLSADEQYGSETAADVYRTRTGYELHGRVGALGWPALVAQNADRSYGSEPGALGRALAGASVDRSVIANADEQHLDGPVLHREAALTLTDAHGRVSGEVSSRLLTEDRNAAFGWNLDLELVMDAFPRDFSTRRQVVLVEASDLARADNYRKLANPNQRAALHANALARSDELVGRLLRRVDPRRDAVVVVAPYHTSRTRTLTVAAVLAPGRPPGFLESATTRRAGFLQSVDIAPTVLNLLGIERPKEMEGRIARVHADADTYPDRLDWLVRNDRAAQFRDTTIGQATATLVAATIVLVAAGILVFAYFRRRWARVALRWASLMLLGYVAATYVVGLFPMFRWGTAVYVASVVALAGIYAAVCLVLGRRSIVDPALIGLGCVIVMHSVDLLTGAHLQLNTVFGYSPTVGIRLAGIGNPGSAELSAAAMLFAILLAWRAPVRGPRVGFAVLAFVLIVVAAPMWGQDFGGALTLGPTIVLWWLLQTGRRVSGRIVATMGAVLLGTGLVAGFVDLTRPANERTHVGRFFEKVGDDGVGAFLGVIGRKASLMIGTFSNTAWVLLVVSVLVGIWLAARRSDLLATIVRRVPTLRPGLVCFALLVGLGTVLNDSGVQVTAMMLATLLAVLVLLATRVEDEASDDGALDSPPATPAGAPAPAHSLA